MFGMIWAFLKNILGNRKVLVVLGFLALVATDICLLVLWGHLAANLPEGDLGTGITLLAGLLAALLVSTPAGFGLLLRELFD